jgi:hypothetical protein
MILQSWQSGAGKITQLRVLAVLGFVLEQGNSLHMVLDHALHVGFVELVAG